MEVEFMLSDSIEVTPIFRTQRWLTPIRLLGQS